MIFGTDLTIALIAIAPFLAAVLAPFIFRFSGYFAGWILAIIPVSIFIYLLGFIEPVSKGGFIQSSLKWIPQYNLNFSFFIDGLSLTFALLISGIGTFIVIYSGKYLKGHPDQGKFLAYILMFMGSMLGLVLADNLVVLFIFWELTSITSFLLIGFDHKRQASRRAAIQALVVTGAGGLALLVGIIMLQQLLGNWEFSAIRNYSDYLQSLNIYPLVLVLISIAAFTKSAQFPFHFWLPNAMEAPTPVSAFLHSATMVKAGVYLLARMNPLLGASDLWFMILTIFGSVTLLWGAIWALKQTDMKLMLAQTTVASLGLLVILIGVGTEIAISAMVIYLVAHALYKAGLFLLVGIIDHGTGTRNITELAGLKKFLPISFIAAIIGAISMAGLPPTIGFFAKEEMYLALMRFDIVAILIISVLILGNSFMLVVGAAIATKPFLGEIKPTPIKPHEGNLALLSGPVLLGILALAAGIFISDFGKLFVNPTASTIYNYLVENHLKWYIGMFFKPLILFSIITWIIGAILFYRLENIRSFLRRLDDGFNWDFDKGFDAIIFSLIRFADFLTRLWHHGRLELYMVVVFVLLAAAVLIPLTLTGAIPSISTTIPYLTFYEWGVIIMAALGLFALLIARTRLVAIVSMGIQGFAVALIFMLFGAPDLAFTQFMVEILTVVILALVMSRLYLDRRDNRIFEDILRDGSIALIGGIGISILLIAIVQNPLDLRLTEFFALTSKPIAHGSNIVNVILVDYRGLDTLGEIAVVMTAGIAVLALIRIRAGGPQLGIGAAKNNKRRNKVISKKTSNSSANKRSRKNSAHNINMKQRKAQR